MIASLEALIYFGIFLSVFIFLRLVSLGKKIHFISIMFLIYYFCYIVFGSLMVYYFFKIWWTSDISEGSGPIMKVGLVTLHQYRYINGMRHIKDTLL